MNGQANEDEFDRALRKAMRRRPEPLRFPNLAARAIAQASAADAPLQSSGRSLLAFWYYEQSKKGAGEYLNGIMAYRRWTRIAALAAGILIVIILAVGIRRIATLQSGTTAPYLADSSVVDSSSTSLWPLIDLSTTRGWMLAGFVAAGIAAIGLVVGSTFWGEDAENSAVLAQGLT